MNLDIDVQSKSFQFHTFKSTFVSKHFYILSLSPLMNTLNSFESSLFLLYFLYTSTYSFATT